MLPLVSHGLTVSMPTAQTDGLTDGRTPDRYITLSVSSQLNNYVQSIYQCQSSLRITLTLWLEFVFFSVIAIYYTEFSMLGHVAWRSVV